MCQKRIVGARMNEAAICRSNDGRTNEPTKEAPHHSIQNPHTQQTKPRTLRSKEVFLGIISIEVVVVVRLLLGYASMVIADLFDLDWTHWRISISAFCPRSGKGASTAPISDAACRS